MKVTQRKLPDGKLQLECVATAAEVNGALQQAYIGFAQQMGLTPEPNKSVSQIVQEKTGIRDLDSVVGDKAAQALVPFAVEKKRLTPAYPPKPQFTRPIRHDNEFSFTIEVTPKPAFELDSYDPVEIELAPFYIDEAEVDRRVAEMAENYAQYEDDEPHEVRKGDSVKLAIKCTENGRELKGLTTEGRVYTTGEGYMPEGFDANVIGMNPGETKSFTFDGPSFDANGKPTTQKVDCTVTLHSIQKKVVPTLDDEWVKTYMPMYKSAADLRQSIHDNMEGQGREQYEDYRRSKVASELGRRFKGRIPDEVYEAMREQLLQNVRKAAEQEGKTFEQFIDDNGGQQQFSMMLMMQIRELLVQGYALDAVYRHEHLSVSDEDIEGACLTMNPQVNPKMLRQRIEQSGSGYMLREAAERLCANKWAVEHAKISYASPSDGSDAAAGK